MDNFIHRFSTLCISLWITLSTGFPQVWTSCPHLHRFSTGCGQPVDNLWISCPHVDNLWITFGGSNFAPRILQNFCEPIFGKAKSQNSILCFRVLGFCVFQGRGWVKFRCFEISPIPLHTPFNQGNIHQANMPILRVGTRPPRIPNPHMNSIIMQSHGTPIQFNPIPTSAGRHQDRNRIPVP